jgi:NADPH:quinone reductase-like Zn-dependent oxidoreductase
MAPRRTSRPDSRTGQVLVRVQAVSLNYRDLMIAKGSYGGKLPEGRIPFSCGAGEVLAVGPAVTRFQPGDRVAGTFFQSWLAGEISESDHKSALGGGIDGMLAERAVLSQEGLVPFPAHLSFEEAATLPCAALTAWQALVTRGGVAPGSTVLVMGTGGVSIFALQFARLAGARVIATSSSDSKLERAAKLGASDGINYRTFPDWSEVTRKLTGGRGVDHVVEVGGAGTLAQSFEAVRHGGRISVIGILTGVGGEVNPLPILRKSITVQGIFVGSREMFSAMNRAIEVSQLRPVIDRVFPFDEAPAALQYLESGGHFGKVCIRTT